MPAANRRAIREAVVRSIFECEFRDCKKFHEEIFVRNMQEMEILSYDMDFAKALTDAVFSHCDEFKEWVEKLAPDWPYSKIARLDRSVICAGLAELKYLCASLDIPPKVTLNEYVEITKAYSEDSSRKFVNGVLSSALKELELNQND
jgi:N utilization substance protein B